MPLGLVEPGGQAHPGAAVHPVQLSAVPSVSAYEPSGQVVQVVEPGGEKVPKGHVKHVELSVADAMVL